MLNYRQRVNLSTPKTNISAFEKRQRQKQRERRENMTHDTFWVVCFCFYFCFGRSGWGNVLIREKSRENKILKNKSTVKPSGWGFPTDFQGFFVLSGGYQSMLVSYFGVTMSEACSRSYGSAAKLFSKGKWCVMVSEQWGPGTGNIILKSTLLCYMNESC